MILHAEAPRGHCLDARQAFIEFKHPFTNAAEKMVVMAFVRTLVPWRLAGNLHRNHAPVFREGFQRAIDCRQSNAGRVFVRQLLDSGAVNGFFCSANTLSIARFCRVLLITPLDSIKETSGDQWRAPED